MFKTKGGRFEAKAGTSNGKSTYLGTYGTALEAAVAYALHVQSLEAPESAQPAALDECDGLQLHLSATNPTGYKGVYVKRGTGRFEAKVCSHGQLHHIGNFDTALQAAEAYARHVQSLESA